MLVGEKVGQETMEYLRTRRGEGASWRFISMQLLSEHGIDVTEVTLRKWWSDAQESAQEATAGKQ